MWLFIVEKLSLVCVIVDVLFKLYWKGDGFIECGNGQVVIWCIGYLFEQVQLDVYDSCYVCWNFVDLLIVLEKW